MTDKNFLNGRKKKKKRVRRAAEREASAAKNKITKWEKKGGNRSGGKRNGILCRLLRRQPGWEKGRREGWLVTRITSPGAVQLFKKEVDQRKAGHIAEQIIQIHALPLQERRRRSGGINTTENGQGKKDEWRNGSPRDFSLGGSGK